MHFIILGLLALITILLIILLRGRSEDEGGSGIKRKKRQKTAPEKPAFCLLCSEELKKGVPMRSSLYPEDGKGGRLMEMHGCDACIPPRGKRVRKCPVCGHKLKNKDAVIARRYEVPGKNRVNVLGCPACYRPSSG